jgi:hypothetical protein
VDAIGVGVDVRAGVAVGDGEWAPVGVGECVATCVAVCVTVAETVGVGDCPAVGVGV